MYLFAVGKLSSEICGIYDNYRRTDNGYGIPDGIPDGSIIGCSIHDGKLPLF
jgi:hypothetical protein